MIGYEFVQGLLTSKNYKKPKNFACAHENMQANFILFLNIQIKIKRIFSWQLPSAGLTSIMSLLNPTFPI